MEQGITTIKVKVLSGPRPGERRRTNGRVRRIETQKAIAENGDIVVFELGDEEPVGKDVNIEIRGYARTHNWAGAQSGRTGKSMYISDVLSLKPAEINEKAFAFREVSDFVQVLGAPQPVSVD